MLIKGITLAGWRSFSPGHPAVARDLRMVNLLIGPNNVGKSNLGRFIVRVRNILVQLGYQTSDPWGDAGAYYIPLELHFEPEEIDHWLRESAPVNAEIWLDEGLLGYPGKLDESLSSNDGVKFSIAMKIIDGKGVLSIVPISVGGKDVIVKVDNVYKLLLPGDMYSEQVTSLYKHRGLGLAACKFIANSIIEIKPLRDPTRKSAIDFFRTTDGGDVIGALEEKMKNPNGQALWDKLQNDLEQWFKILLGEENIRIEIISGKFWIITTRGESRLRCELSDLGSGVSEILMLLAYLRLHSDKPFFVVIDEPEAHLHPGAVVELAKIITNDLPRHQLLITTHSTALIDAVTPQWRAFRVMRADHQGTAFEAIDTAESELSLLADLGVRPSQLFLARVALWVEGPSDVFYWTALLREVDSNLVVNRDFVFITYGGASSSHLDFNNNGEEEEPEKSESRLVQVLKVSHKAVIICDRDRNSGDDDRSLVNRLKSAAAKLPQHARVEVSIGREIENSVKSSVLLSVLEEVRPIRFNKPKKLSISYVDYAIGADDSFDEVVSAAARAEDGSELTSDQVAKIKRALEQKKSDIGKRVHDIGLKESIFEPKSVEAARALVKWLVSDPVKYCPDN